MESTLGNSNSLLERSRKTELDRLASVIRHTLTEKQGSVLIPAFALGKCQELLTVLAGLREKGKIPDADIYITESGRKISELYDATVDVTSRINPESRLRDIVHLNLTGHDLKKEGAWLKKPSILIATSGMMFERTPSNILAQKMIPDEKHTICFVGYIPPRHDRTSDRQCRAGNRNKTGRSRRLFSAELRSREISFHCSLKKTRTDGDRQTNST